MAAEEEENVPGGVYVKLVAIAAVVNMLCGIGIEVVEAVGAEIVPKCGINKSDGEECAVDISGPSVGTNEDIGWLFTTWGAIEAD